MNPIHRYRRQKTAERNIRRLILFPNVTVRKLVTLKTLADSLFSEIEALEKTLPVENPRVRNLAKEVEAFEREAVRAALVRAGGNQLRAAKLLNVKPSTLNMMIKRLNLSA
jgi:transcriptional regulator with GAF, ATPase, and Fis domain